MTRSSGGTRIVGQTNCARLAEQEEALLTFYVSRDDGRIALFLDGEKQEIWRDADPGTGVFGDWFQVFSEDHHPLEISMITIEEWDGHLPGERPRIPGDFEPTPEWVEQLTPPGTWPAAVAYRDERRRIQDRFTAALNGPPGPERNRARHEATRAVVEAQRRYNQALEQFPMAELDPENPGHVINPFTGQSLDARGVTSGSRIWDPRTRNRSQVFRVP